MSEGKGADDLHVFDDLVKGISSYPPEGPGQDTAASWRGGTLRPQVGAPGGLMGPPFGAPTNRPASPAPPARSSPLPPASSWASAGPLAPPGRASPTSSMPASPWAGRPLPALSGPPPALSSRPPLPAARRRSPPAPLPPPARSSSGPPVSAAAQYPSEPGTNGDAGPRSENPFLAPAQAPEEGGPDSLLPPPITQKRSSFPPHKRSTPPPPGFLRPPPTVRPLPPPPPRVSPSTPPPGLGTTIPPFGRSSLDSDIAALHERGRRKKVFAFATLVAVVAAGYYYGRDKLSAVAATAFKPQRASLRATAKRNGIKLVLDGKEIGMLPQDVNDIAPGEHSVVFEGGERYTVQRSSVTLWPDQTKVLDPVSLKVAKGAATFDVKTPGTSLVLISTDEKRTLTDYSHAIDIDNTKSWALEATKPGFKPLTMPITFDDDAEKTFVVALTEPSKSTADSPLQDVVNDPQGAKGGRGASGKAEPRLRAVAAAPARAAQAGDASDGTCTLSINSIPTSRITLDGHFIGMTPKVGISVPAGAHSVMLATDSSRKVTSASCRAGEQKTIAVRIAQ